MANTSSAKKCVRKMAHKTSINKSRRSSVRTILRRTEEAIASGDQEAARKCLKDAEPAMMRAARKGVYHQNTAARKISRLTLRMQKMG